MKKNSVHSVNLFSNWPSQVACSAVSFDPGRVHTIREITQKIFILSISFPYLQNVSHMWSSCRNDINRSIFCRIVVSKMLSDTQCALSAAILWYKVFCLQFLFFPFSLKKICALCFRAELCSIGISTVFDFSSFYHFHSNREFLQSFLLLTLSMVKGHWFISVSCSLLPRFLSSLNMSSWWIKVMR